MTNNALLTSLKSANLLPSAIIPETFTPSLNLNVKFPSSGLAPENGSLARVSQVKDQPVISVVPSSSSSPQTTISNSTATTYTFMMIDPDRFEAAFLSLSVGEAEVAHILAAARKAFRAL